MSPFTFCISSLKVFLKSEVRQNRHFFFKWKALNVFNLTFLIFENIFSRIDPNSNLEQWSLKGFKSPGLSMRSHNTLVQHVTTYIFQQAKKPSIKACLFWVLLESMPWHPTPVLLPGKSHGWRSLVGCSPWGRSESDTTERLHFHFSALEKEMATHSSVLAWRIPGTGEPGGLPSMGSHRVGHD